METTIDALLNRRITVEQPKKGFRIAVDTLLLASAINARTGEKVVDLGCGVGGAMLALAVRVLGLTVNGLEIQPELAELCRNNIKRNTYEDRMEAITGDVTHLPGPLLFCYDHVMMNPPYHDAAKHGASPNESKAIANTGTMEELEMWIISAARCLKQTGHLVMIHRADRQDEILTYMKPHFGDTEIIPLLPKENEPANRILLRSRKGQGAKVIPCRPMTIHRKSGGYTDEMEAILKHNRPIDFMPVKVK
jgi:tRNA1(Val) A37 N6-methylase TrmN6